MQYYYVYVRLDENILHAEYSWNNISTILHDYDFAYKLTVITLSRYAEDIIKIIVIRIHGFR